VVVLRLTRIRPGQGPLWTPVAALWLDTRRTAMRETGADHEPALAELQGWSTILVAEAGGEVVAACAWRRTTPTDLDALPRAVAEQLEVNHPESLTVGQMCVAPAHRRSGIPDALVGAFVERLAEGPETAGVVRTRDSRRMDQLALRHGGVKVGEVMAFGERSSVFLHMRPLG
jgi:GNAT superfamily N-acetyltransferase